MAATPTREKIAHPDASAFDLATIMRTVGDPVSRAEGTQRLVSLRTTDLESRFPGLVGVLTKT